MTKKKEKTPAQKPAEPAKAEAPAETNVSPPAPASPEATAPKAPEGAAPAAGQPLFGQGDGQVQPATAPAATAQPPVATAQPAAAVPAPVAPTPAPAATGMVVAEPASLAALRNLTTQALAIADIDDAMAQTFQLTALMDRVENVLEMPEIKGMILKLKNSPMGFLTDEKPAEPNTKLDWSIVKAACTEALCRGIPIANNHFNIIARRCYVTKNGIAYMLDRLREKGDLDDYQIIQDIPQTAGGGKGAVVKTKITWTYRGQKGEENMIFSCKLHPGQGADVAQGKVERKAGNWLYQRLKHIRLPDGQLPEDEDIPVSNQTSAPPPPPPSAAAPALPQGVADGALALAAAAPAAPALAAPIPPATPAPVAPAAAVPQFPVAPPAPVAKPPPIDVGQGDAGMPQAPAPPVAAHAAPSAPTAPDLNDFDRGNQVIKEAVAEFTTPWVTYYLRSIKWIPVDGLIEDIEESSVKLLGQNAARFRVAVQATIQNHSQPQQ